ncbi:hypothetical protein NUW58_g562 [Xylaria curta]|uniref:Uncharacterized protein n=1 Tax=Xylaria curta TaxID=42375 RepID=A0ACC1PRJ0_9PEZI|nr:hypothetical protein NUW58_g562 [Xylaria curta]
MQFTTTAIAAILSASAVFAAPAAIPSWTVTNMKRVCNAGDTSCTWTFGINTNTGAAATPCSFVITGSPASHSDTSGTKACGTFSVTAGWSGQIAWPAYTDAELAGGKVVTPNKSWAVTQM